MSSQPWKLYQGDSTVRVTALAEGFYFNMGVENIGVSAEEQSHLEGVYRRTRSERWAGDESEKLWQIVDSM